MFIEITILHHNGIESMAKVPLLGLISGDAEKVPRLYERLPSINKIQNINIISKKVPSLGVIQYNQVTLGILRYHLVAPFEIWYP